MQIVQPDVDEHTPPPGEYPAPEVPQSPRDLFCLRPPYSNDGSPLAPDHAQATEPWKSWQGKYN